MARSGALGAETPSAEAAAEAAKAAEANGKKKTPPKAKPKAIGVLRRPVQHRPQRPNQSSPCRTLLADGDEPAKVRLRQAHESTATTARFPEPRLRAVGCWRDQMPAARGPR